MAHITLNIFSEALEMQTAVEVVIPQRSTSGEIGTSNKETKGKYKCLYLLHGLSDDETIWLRRTSIERYASDNGFAVVMPSGAKSFYCDTVYGMKYYTYIAKELPAIIEDMFNISPEREDRYIGGLSMGGYGALKIALREEGRYAAAFALSPVADIHNERFSELMAQNLGGTIPEDADIFSLVTAHNSDKIKPRLYITIGKDDFMYNDSVRLNKHISALDYDYKYVETDGNHSWYLWDTTVRSAINWMLNK